MSAWPSGSAKKPPRPGQGRRQRRIDATPEPLRTEIRAFAEHLVRSEERARRAGTRPRADATIEQTLAVVRDLARFILGERIKNDWAAADIAGIDAFLAVQPTNRRRRLQAAGQFFRWARKNKVVLIDPTRGRSGGPQAGFTDQTMSLDEQRRILCRWRGNPDVHPHEALVRILALLHAASNIELRHVCPYPNDLIPLI